ncbi:MAG: hypothetical protein JO159_07370 [Acidobacteria bacterium]|nr:hypothetical protein [Acidobacteriota bacterium]
MPRVRTAKTLAKRIDLQYFSKRSSFRSWRLLLSLLLPVIAGGWILGEALFHKHSLYSSGPVSAAHAVFAAQCTLCHIRANAYAATAVDKTCLGCHDAPAHNQRQTYTPACGSCHVEHQGRLRLAATSDSACTQCHNHLMAASGGLRFDPHISGFDHAHPQFAALRAGQTDPGTIRLNHYAHLQPTLRGPAGPVQLRCYDCHRAINVTEPWPYSVAVVQPASQQPVMVGQAEAQQRKRRSVEAGPGAYMTPIKYVNQCAACHVLQFDPLIATPAPHARPEVVHAFIVEKLTEYIREHPSAIGISPNTMEPVPPTADTMQPNAATGQERNPLQPLRQGQMVPQQNVLRPTGPATPPPTSAQNWVEQRASTAERLLWEKNCKICHVVTEGGGNGLPTSVKAVIPVRWFPHAEFDHEAHRMMDCTACHLNIPQSKLTTDINIPGIEICRDCHKQNGSRAGAAEGRCFECHSYHDWRSERRVQGKLDIREIRGSGPVPVAQAADQGTLPAAK